VFHEVTGRKYTDWLNSLRIEKAKELLSDWELKLYEVADRVGFSDYKYFVRVFRRYTGCRPSEYRSRISER